jgi:hypothetical protein
MDAKAALQERKELFNDCIAFRKPKRVPAISNVFSWKILDAGYKLTEAIMDYDIMEKLVCEFHERYQFDAYLDLGSRNSIKPTSEMGVQYYVINDEMESINYIDRVLMEGNEYKEFAANPKAFYWKMFLRKYPDATKGQFASAIRKFMEFMSFNTRMVQKFTTEYGVFPVLNMQAVTMNPFESIYQTYRGIKGMAIDLRKYGGDIKELLDVLYETELAPRMAAAMKSSDGVYVCDMYTALLGHSILNAKQFEEFYWPYLKKTLDAVIAAGKTIFIFSESDILRFAEYFQDMPKGTVVLHPELDDIFELRKKLPNICLAAGIKTGLLGHGTKQDCIDYAKKLIDGLGDGIIISQDKMISYRNDCKRENLLAVNEFIRDYTS